MEIAGLFNYWMTVILMMTGFYIIITHGNLVKKLIGMSLFQSSVFILFISMGKIHEGSAPILSDSYSVYSSPLPHVLILTAIVVGIATTALGLALIVRMHQVFGTIEEDEIKDWLDKQ